MNNTSEPVICPLSFNIKLSFVEFICVDASSKPPIVPPLNNTCEPVICPFDLSTRLSLEEFICDESTTNPPIEADLNVANPCESILELAFKSVDATPAIVDGVRMLFAVISP